jgi:hypothetical protein
MGVSVYGMGLGANEGSRVGVAKAGRWVGVNGTGTLVRAVDGGVGEPDLKTLTKGKYKHQQAIPGMRKNIINKKRRMDIL